MSYAWENNIQRSWDAIEEDEDGILRSVDVGGEDGSGGQKHLLRRNSSFGFQAGGMVDDGGRTICKSMIRYVCVVIDMSRAMAENDIRPSRRSAAIEILKSFFVAFFDENPLSNLCVLTSNDGLAHKVTEMSGSPNRHLAGVSVLAAESGEFSLQNALELSRAALASVPQHASKEVLVITASLSTCDQGDIFETIDTMKKNNIRCSVVGMCAEVHVSKYLTQKTQGKYGVSKNKQHLRTLIMEHVNPPPVLTESRNSLRCMFVRMGFPSQGATREGTRTPTSVSNTVSTKRQALCADTNQISTNGYYCPRCNTVNTELPCKCSVCSLELIASSHLARSYHHLFPVGRFTPVPLTACVHSSCTGCGAHFKRPGFTIKTYYQCHKCDTFFCDQCEAYIHETLHNCPSCLEDTFKAPVKT
mmetsp:Transcript_3961/g.5759  ORF Transcript_3961/g.5759 Transcript_3961/m.5759 type:complete len:417 (-) Transcript_3961:268-1518(-)